MIQKRLISDIIIPMRTSDTGEIALETMEEFNIRHLPVVNDKELLGVLSEDDIFNNNIQQPLGSYALSLPKPSVKLDDHLFDVMRVLARHQLTTIPVVDQQDNYVGLVTAEDLIQHLSMVMPFDEPGGIIVLSMTKKDYSLSELARIIESEKAVILSSYVTTEANSNEIEVTIKINRQNYGAILATLERFEYNIKATYNEELFYDSFKERYDSLINYLNV